MPSKQALRNYISRTVTHTDWPVLRQSLFHLTMKRRSRSVYWLTLALIALLVLLTWPTDYTYFSNDDIIRTYFRWRVVTLTGIGAYLVLIPMVDFVKRHIYWLVYAGVIAEVALTGYFFGQINATTLETPWFYVSYIVPFITLIFDVRIWRRTLATVTLPVVYVVAFLQFRTGSAYWGYKYNDANFNILLSATLISILLGHLIYHLNRSNFLQSRQLRIQRRRIQKLANHDSLTGLFNRREFDNRIKQEFTRAKRYEQSLAIIMIDLDHFKKINDTYGHPAGDRVLEAMGKIILRVIRKTDFASRYGGEEFCIALPETELKNADTIANRLREQLASESFRTQAEEFTVTCSVGITEQHPSDQNFEDTLKRADQALYTAKSRGRNRVVQLN